MHVHVVPKLCFVPTFLKKRRMRLVYTIMYMFIYMYVYIIGFLRRFCSASLYFDLSGVSVDHSNVLIHIHVHVL